MFDTISVTFFCHFLLKWTIKWVVGLHLRRTDTALIFWDDYVGLSEPLLGLIFLRLTTRNNASKTNFYIFLLNKTNFYIDGDVCAFCGGIFCSKY